MYVYRDDGAPEEPLAPSTTSAAVDEQEAAYWYGAADPEPSAPPDPEVRGPFEPLVPSGSLSAESLDGGAADAAPVDAAPAAGDEVADAADQHAQKLEQIKDFYLTAEAIGEENVDKHFDQLLAQQRELIGEYFKHSRFRDATEAGTEGTGQAGTAPGGTVPDGTAPDGTAPDGAAQAGV